MNWQVQSLKNEFKSDDVKMKPLKKARKMVSFLQIIGGFGKY